VLAHFFLGIITSFCNSADVDITSYLTLEIENETREETSECLTGNSKNEIRDASFTVDEEYASSDRYEQLSQHFHLIFFTLASAQSL